MIYLLLFWEFCKVGLFCVGGGYASMPLIQASVVDGYHWLSLKEFLDIFTISQMTPGPIGINAATFAGMKIAGVPGAVCATAGFVTPSLFLCIIVTRLILKYGDVAPIRRILNGLRPAVVALICSAGLGFVILSLWNSETVPQDFKETLDWRGIVLLTGAFIAVRMKVKVIKLLVFSGIAGLILGLAAERF
jgi:chromate transporter